MMLKYSLLVKSDREEILCNILYICNLKGNDRNELTYKNRFTDLENKLMVICGEFEEKG